MTHPSLKYFHISNSRSCKPYIILKVYPLWLFWWVFLLMKVLKSSSPKTDPWGTPLLTGLHPDTEPLITTLWLHPASQFLIHQTVHPSNPYLSNLERRMWWGTMSKFFNLFNHWRCLLCLAKYALHSYMLQMRGSGWNERIRTTPSLIHTILEVLIFILSSPSLYDNGHQPHFTSTMGSCMAQPQLLSDWGVHLLPGPRR